MRKHVCLGLAVIVAGLVVTSLQQRGQAQDKSAAARTVKVKLNYTGASTVDEKHKIYVAIWDSPDFTTGNAGMPIATGSQTQKHGTVTITGVSTARVYASAVYDSSGTWEPQSGPPPSGSPVGMYSKTPGKPEPIEVAEGKTVEVQLTFDDSVKMP